MHKMHIGNITPQQFIESFFSKYKISFNHISNCFELQDKETNVIETYTTEEEATREYLDMILEDIKDQYGN